MSSMNNNLVDKRTVERNIEKGLISKQEHEDYLAKLRDLDGQFELVESSAEDTGIGDASERSTAPPPATTPPPMPTPSY